VVYIIDYMGKAIRGELGGDSEKTLKDQIEALKSGTSAAAADIIINGGPHPGNTLEQAVVVLAEELNTPNEISAAIKAIQPPLKVGP